MRYPPVSERLFAKVSRGPSCWIWTGKVHKKTGYGELWSNGRGALAHRVSWELSNGSIPKGGCVLHRCDVRTCVNPDHLFLGSKGINNTDRNAKGRSAIGEKNGLAKLTADVVAAIRLDSRNNTDAALHYGVCRTSISNVRAGKTWRHV